MNNMRASQVGDNLNLSGQRIELNSKICSLDYTVKDRSAYLYSDIDYVRLGTVDAVRYHSSNLKGGRRSIQHIRKDKADVFLFVLPLTFPLSISQSGRTVTLEPGSSSLLSTARPFVAVSGSPSGNIYSETVVRIPGSQLRQKLPCVDECCAKSITVGSGGGKVLASLIADLVDERNSYSERLAKQFGRSLVDDISILIAETPDVKNSLDQKKLSAHEKILECAINYIESNLSNPELNPALIAEHCNISQSYLFAAFSASSLRVGALIREMRLQRCREAFMDPLVRRHQSITQIAMHWGFTCSSSFNHTYRKRFGKSPSKDRGEPI